jgi:hypothetical protein
MMLQTRKTSPKTGKHRPPAAHALSKPESPKAYLSPSRLQGKLGHNGLVRTPTDAGARPPLPLANLSVAVVLCGLPATLCLPQRISLAEENRVGR